MDWKQQILSTARPRATIHLAPETMPYIDQIKGRVAFHFTTSNLLINQVPKMDQDHFLVDFKEQRHKFSMEVHKDEK